MPRRFLVERRKVHEAHRNKKAVNETNNNNEPAGIEKSTKKTTAKVATIRNSESKSDAKGQAKAEILRKRPECRKYSESKWNTCKSDYMDIYLKSKRSKKVQNQN